MTPKLSSPSKSKSAALQGNSKAETIFLRVPPSATDDNGAAAFDESQLPVLCSFPGGVPQGAQEQPDGSVATEALKFKWATDKRTKQRMLLGQDQACLYLAPDIRHQQPMEKMKPSKEGTKKRPIGEASNSGTRMCIGIYDKQKQTLTLHEVSGQGHIYPLSQSVPSYIGNNSNAEDENNRFSYLHNRRMLFEDFGSSKKRKAIRSEDANRVNVSQVVGSGRLVVNSVLKGEGMSDSNKRAIQEKQQETQQGPAAAPGTASAAIHAATEQWRRELLPTFHRYATSAREVYDLKEASGGAEWWDENSHYIDKCLEQQDVASAMIDGLHFAENKGSDGATKSFRDCWKPSLIAMVERLARTARPIEKCKEQFMYMNSLRYLIDLYRTLSVRRRIVPLEDDRNRYLGAPRVLAQFFLNTFCTETLSQGNQISGGGGGGYVMSKPNKDKCIIYILLVLLAAEGGKAMTCATLEPVLNDMKVDLKDASNLLLTAGCTVTKNSKTGKTSATLTVPLTFPALSGSGRRSRSKK